MKLWELFVQLGVKADIPILRDVVDTLHKIPTEALDAIASLAGIEFSLLRLTQGAMETSVAFQLFESMTGLSADELERWQLGAEQANVSAEAVASSVSALERNLAAIRLGQGNIAPFQMLGIDVRGQSAFSVLEQIRNRIRGLDRATSTNLLQQMGVSPEMIQVLSLSDQKFAEFTHHIKGLSREQRESFLQTKLELVRLGETFRYTMYGMIETFMRANRESEKFAMVMRILRDVLVGLGIYFFPLTAAITGLLLLLEDLATYATGGSSLTGLALGAIQGKAKGAAGALESILPHNLLGSLLNPAGLTAGVAGAAGNIFNVTVNATGDPQAIAKAVGEELQRLFRNTHSQLNNGGK